MFLLIFPPQVLSNTQNVKLLIHQEGKRFEVSLKEDFNNNNSVAKAISKDQLFNGVNTITLFVNERPIAERLIFNKKSILSDRENVSAFTSKSTSDSLSLKLSLPNFNKKAHLSISVLPENTISYNKRQNISSAFLLDPFINGYIENKAYYFNNRDRKTNYDLDLLLLTQGWSKYDWQNILYKTPKLSYDRQDGLTQNINFNGKIPERVNKFLIYSTIYNNEQILELNGDKTIKLKKRYPLIGENMEFSFITDKNDFIRPYAVVGTPLKLNTDKLSKEYLNPSFSSLRNQDEGFNKDRLYDNFLSGELLDEVIVKTSKNEEENKSKKQYSSTFRDNSVIVDEEIVTTYPLLSDYLAYKGYLVTDVLGVFRIRPLARGTLNGGSAPGVILNGIRLFDLSVLSGTRTEDFEEIFVDKTGYGGGMQGANGIIKLRFRETALFTNEDYINTKLPYSQFEIKKGFEPPKQFYMPEYAFFNTEEFQHVGTIGWFTDVIIEPNQQTELKLFDTKLYNFKLFIEGIGEDGSIINIEKTVSR